MKSLLLGVVLEEVLSHELHWVGRALLGNLGEGLKQKGDDGLVEVCTDGQSLELAGTGVFLLR